MDSLPQEVDGEAWRAELARQHTYLANVVDQACAWTREFHVQTGGVELCGNYTPLKSYPPAGLREQAETAQLSTKKECAQLLRYSLRRRPGTARPCMRPPRL